jgi:hypothetical protein
MRTIVAAAMLAALVTTAVAGARPAAKPNLEAASAYTARAIATEQLAIAELRRHPPNWDDATAKLQTSETTLGTVAYKLTDALDAKELSGTARSEIRAPISSAEHEDSVAQREIRLHHATTAIAAIRRALADKQRSRTILLGELLSTKCESEKTFTVYAPGDGSTGVWNDVFVHNVPADAHNIIVTFIDQSTGKAPIPTAFGSQLTWDVEPGQFMQLNGETVYRVRVNVRGAGSGPKDANHRVWTARVTWGC